MTASITSYCRVAFRRPKHDVKMSSAERGGSSSPSEERLGVGTSSQGPGSSWGPPQSWEPEVIYRLVKPVRVRQDGEQEEEEESGEYDVIWRRETEREREGEEQ